MANFNTPQGQKHPSSKPKGFGKRKTGKQIPLHEKRTDSFIQAAKWAGQDRRKSDRSWRRANGLTLWLGAGKKRDSLG
jgi:hypothetical protein